MLGDNSRIRAVLTQKRRKKYPSANGLRQEPLFQLVANYPVGVIGFLVSGGHQAYDEEKYANDLQFIISNDLDTTQKYHVLARIAIGDHLKGLSIIWLADGYRPLVYVIGLRRFRELTAD